MNEQGESTASYRWIACVREPTVWSSRLQEDCRNFFLESKDYTSLKLMKTNRKATACEVVGLGNTRDFQPIISKIIIPKHWQFVFTSKGIWQYVVGTSNSTCIFGSCIGFWNCAIQLAVALTPRIVGIIIPKFRSGVEMQNDKRSKWGFFLSH